MKKRMIALLLLAGLLLAGCGGTTTETTAETGTETAAAVEETEVSLDPMIEAIDCGGRTYTILSRLSDGSNYCYPYHEYLAEEATGEAINDAIFQRNTFLEEKYNLVFSMPEEADMEGIVKKTVTAGDAIYDLINIPPQQGYNLSVAGMLRNMNNIPHIDITKPYWRASVMENTSTGGTPSPPRPDSRPAPPGFAPPRARSRCAAHLHHGLPVSPAPTPGSRRASGTSLPAR